MTTVNNYTVYCSTEATYKYNYWLTSTPTTCPSNSTHTIDTAKTTVVDSVSSEIVTIKETSVETQGRYQVAPYTLDITSSASPQTFNYQNNDYPFNVYMVSFQSEEDHRGDYLDVLAAPYTTVGAITSNVTAGDTVINVSSGVITYMKVGYRVTLTDGTNTDELGYCREVNSISNTITVGTAAAHSFAAATPTYVQFSIGFTRAPILLHTPREYVFGGGKMGASYVPKGAVNRIIYTNNSGVAKKMVLFFETDY